MRLDLALQHNSLSILENNSIMQKLLALFKEDNQNGKLESIIDSLPPINEGDPEITFREAIFFATRHLMCDRKLIELTEKEDDIVLQREKIVLELLKKATVELETVLL